MSEVKSRPSAPRGRGSARGRGGYSSRGGRGGSRQANGHKEEIPTDSSYEEGGELGDLKKMYASKLSIIKEMFPDWTDEDLVFALQETNGDLEGTIDRISEGTYLALVYWASLPSTYMTRFYRQHFSMGRGKEEDKRAFSVKGQRATIRRGSLHLSSRWTRKRRV